MAALEFVFNSMPKFDRKTHTLSDWLSKLERRFGLTKIEEDEQKIAIAQLYIGQTGEDILGGLGDDATWAQAKAALASRLGEGTQSEEAWNALKHLTKGGKELVDLGCEVEKLAKQAYPGQPGTAERHAIEAFLQALDKPLAVEVQKLGHSKLADVITAARRIEKLQLQTPSQGLEGFVSVMQDEIRALRKELEKPKPTSVNLTQPQPAAAPAVALAPPAEGRPYARHYLVPVEDGYVPRRRQQGNRSQGQRVRCYFCDEEGHVIRECLHKKAWKQNQQRRRQATDQSPRTMPAPAYMTAPTDDQQERPTVTLN